MATIICCDPVASMSGSLDRASKIYYRTRNGRTHAYRVCNPYTGEATEQQTRMRNAFGDIVRQAGAVLRDEEQRKLWQMRFDDYLERVRKSPASYPHPVSTLRGFIISTLTREA